MDYAEVPTCNSSEDQPQPQHDPLSSAIHSLFTNIATIVQSQLQCNTETLELLGKMNLRIADEYNEFGDFAAGLRVFVERLKLKNDNFQQYVERIDEMEKEIGDLEHIISKLNENTSVLEAKLRKAYIELHTD